MSELLNLRDRPAGTERHTDDLTAVPESASHPSPDHGDTAPDPTHEHGWRVESRHRTSLGEVLYVRCAACGTRRVDLREPGTPVPTALSRVLL